MHDAGGFDEAIEGRLAVAPEVAGDIVYDIGEVLIDSAVFSSAMRALGGVVLGRATDKAEGGIAGHGTII